jgi:Sec-independent protein translocase protein TatA
MPYLKRMPGLSTSELAIVVFILLLVVVAGRLARWGEALGSYLYRRRNFDNANDGPSSHAPTQPPAGTAPSSQVPPLP